MTTTICLNMIVKDESHIIVKTLTNLTKYFKFDHWVISDTGSTDTTKELIRDFFKEKNIKGELIETPWKNFGHNRTLALQAAYNKTDYVLIFDADDEIVGDLVLPLPLNQDSYDIQYGSIKGVYLSRPQLLNNRKQWKYVGILHEFLESIDTVKPPVLITGDYYVNLGEFGNRSRDKNKYTNDAKLLESAFYDTQHDSDKSLNTRYAYYCAQSYKEAGDKKKSLEFYKKVLLLDGWLEEKYVSCMRIYDLLDVKEDGLQYLVESSKYNKDRIECIFRLVKYYSINQQPDKSYGYYKQIQTYYETEFFKNGITDRALCINTPEYIFYLPYSMIIICDKIKDYNTAIKMYEIIFKHKYTKMEQWYVTHLISNLQYFYKYVNDSTFFSRMATYIELLRASNFNIDDTLVKLYMGKPESTASQEDTGMIVIAILAKDKGFCLPLYLNCIYNQTYPKSKIHLYIRTNDNKDNTINILKDFIKTHGSEYASVYFNDSSISKSLKKYAHHEWNIERFKILGKIRQDSIEYAQKMKAHYFVADCDNFLIPETIGVLAKNSENGIIGPMLISNRDGDSAYSNFHYDVDANGYIKGNALYTSVLNRKIMGIINVPVIHCTYFINRVFLKNILYDDKTSRHEYVIFSNILRNNAIPQLLDNRKFYGIIEFSETSQELDIRLKTTWKSYFPFRPAVI